VELDHGLIGTLYIGDDSAAAAEGSVVRVDARGSSLRYEVSRPAASQNRKTPKGLGV